MIVVCSDDSRRDVELVVTCETGCDREVGGMFVCGDGEDVAGTFHVSLS